MARLLAADALDRVLRAGVPLDEALQDVPGLEPRDRALAFNILAIALRRLGSLRAVLGQFLDRGLPKSAPKLEALLLMGGAQILFMDVPDHAAVGLSVDIARRDRTTGGFAGLVNAVLRRLAREGAARLANLDPFLTDTPDWLRARWIAAYGPDRARAIAAANAYEPALDVTVKSDTDGWAQRLSGEVLPTGTVRVLEAGPIRALPGFSDGEWWVQDAAAALPAGLLGDVRGLKVADLCAAPGGKTAQLATAGAQVVAVDRSGPRLDRLKENLARLKLSAEVVAADATLYEGGPFDAVLLDAPCSATGTLRRHPDIAWGKGLADIASLVPLQAKLLERAANLVKPGGLLVYSTCSLEPEEGEQQIEALLARRADLERVPLGPNDDPALAAFTTPQGDLRTLPCDWVRGEPERSGLDGFFAARLRKRI
ncbi:MAG: transcription antitermination factor NusB [Pseudomonadota bacterium]